MFTSRRMMVKLLSRLRLSAARPEITTEEFNHLAAVSVEQFAYMRLFTDGEGKCMHSYRILYDHALCCIFTVCLMFPFANCCLDFLGLAVRERDVPKFEDITHYLDYMKLDEPIIGD